MAADPSPTGERVETAAAYLAAGLTLWISEIGDAQQTEAKPSRV